MVISSSSGVPLWLIRFMRWLNAVIFDCSPFILSLQAWWVEEKKEKNVTMVKDISRVRKNITLATVRCIIFVQFYKNDTVTALLCGLVQIQKDNLKLKLYCVILSGQWALSPLLYFSLICLVKLTRTQNSDFLSNSQYLKKGQKLKSCS